MAPDDGTASAVFSIARQLSIGGAVDGFGANQSISRQAQECEVLRRQYGALAQTYGQLYEVAKQIEAQSEERSVTIARLQEENARLRHDLARAEATRDAQAAELKQASEWLQKLIFDT